MPWPVLAAALAAGVGAAWLVTDYTRQIERRSGPAVAVLVTQRPVAAGRRFDELPPGSVKERRVPRMYAPPGAIGSADALAARRAAVDLPSGAPISDSVAVAAAVGGESRLRRGERAVSVEAVVMPDGAEPANGQTVDLLASGIGGATETSLVLSGAELLAVPVDEAAAPGAAHRYTLRVSAVQAASVVRADTFAKQLRLLLRP